MSKAGRIKLTDVPGERMRAATADLRRQYRVRNILLTIVGIEVCAVFILRAWNAF